MERKREAPAVVAQIVVFYRRLCRGSRPLCLAGALPLCLAHLTAPPAQPVHPPLLAAVEAAPPESSEISPGSAGVPPALGSPLQEPDSRRDAGAPRERAPGGEVSRAAAASATPVDNLETLGRTADLLIEVNSAFGVPRSPYGQLIYDIALRHSINPHLVAAMIHVESAFNPRAVSRKGACGLMQLLPATARRFGLQKKKDLFDPRKNLQAGVQYLKWLTQRFGGDVEKILAAYNAGEGAVERFGGIPPYRETQQYVEKVFGLLGFTPEPPAARGGGVGGMVVAGR